MPALMEPSPITATTLFARALQRRGRRPMPSAAEMEVAACAAPKGS
jgi:hypothetical protein